MHHISLRTRNLVLTAAFAAIIFLVTAYLHIPTNNGYTHVGDAFVYLAASLLPTPYGVAAGAVGAMLSDLMSGFAVWAIPSLLIKGITVLFFTCKADKILCARNYIALIPALLLCAAGYTLSEMVITQNVVAPLVAIPSYLIQSIASSIVYIVIGLILDRMRFKQKFSPRA